MITKIRRPGEAPKPAVAVSADHALACRASFVNGVLPHFPASNPRFQRFFWESYALFQSLPRNSPSFPGFALTALGVKGLDVSKPPLSGMLMKQLDALSSLGLGYRIRDSMELEVYDRDSIGPVLSSFFPMSVPISSVGHRAPVSIEAALARFETLNRADPEGYSYQLLAWPSLLAPGVRYNTITIRAGSTSVECPVSVPDIAERAVSTLRGIAAAVSVVEQVRRSLPPVYAGADRAEPDSLRFADS